MKNYTFKTTDKEKNFTIDFLSETSHMFGILIMDQNLSVDVYAISAAKISTILKNSSIENPSKINARKLKVSLKDWSAALLITFIEVKITSE